MSTLLPITYKLDDRPVLVVGGGAIALQKLGWLLKCGASARVVAPEILPEIVQLAEVAPIELSPRAFDPADLDGAPMVIAATDEAAINEHVRDEARRRGVPVNVVDVPELCDFYVPATVRRGELLLTATTGGACPALARVIRQRLERQYPDRLAVVTEALGRVREWLRTQPIATARRFELLGRLAEEALDDQLNDSVEAVFEALRYRAEGWLANEGGEGGE